MINLKVKILIEMTDKGFGTKVASELQKSGIYAIVSNSNEDIKIFDKEMFFEKYRIIVTDNPEKYAQSCVQVIVISSDKNIIDKILYNENMLYVSKDIGLNSICSLIKFHTNCGGDKVKAERLASHFIREMGIQTNLKGYKYLRTGIVFATLKPEIMEHSTYEIYDVIAKKYNVQGSSVERAIRNSIELAYEICPEKMSEKFSYPVAKPSNTELIIFAADTIRTWGL